MKQQFCTFHWFILIGRCAFGIDTDVQNDIYNPYLQKAVEFFKMDIDQSLFVRLSNLMPILARPARDVFLVLYHLRCILTKIMPFLDNYMKEYPPLWFRNHIKAVVDARTKSPLSLKGRVDLLRLMMDASTKRKVIVSIE